MVSSPLKQTDRGYPQKKTDPDRYGFEKGTPSNVGGGRQSPSESGLTLPPFLNIGQTAPSKIGKFGSLATKASLPLDLSIFPLIFFSGPER